METMKKILTGLFLLGLVSVFLAGCNTVEGMGKDIERGGEEIQDAAN